MQWTLAFLETPPAAQKTRPELDAKARAAALSILARLIAQVVKATKPVDATDE